jgi:hypothetical protein
MSIVVQQNFSKLERILYNLNMNASFATESMANEVVEEARANWSASSPAAPGSPPAKVTGELDASIRVIRGNGLYGRIVEVRAIHGKFLELGTRKMAARPWFVPAIIRVANKKLGDKWRILLR